MKNFWQDLKLKIDRPILVLAPMADVTDCAFRQIIAELGKPDVFWTEFVSADGLVLAPEGGKRKLLKDLDYGENEKPIVAQLFSGRPEMMKQAAKMVLDLGFDGLDINMGCPDKSVEKQCAGAALMKNPKLAKEIILAAKEGVENKIPVSVKTRLGYNKDELEGWLPELLSVEPALITIHARTRKEMSLVPARWERVKRAVEIRDGLGSKTLIFGNGDAGDIDSATRLALESGADGAMLGRAIFGNPFLFQNIKREQKSPEHVEGQVPTLEERLKVLIKHTKLFEEKLGGIKNFAVMKKHFKSYLGSFHGAKDLRDTLMQAENAAEVEVVLNNFIKTL